MAADTRRRLLAGAGLALGASTVPASLLLTAPTADADARLVELGREFHAYYAWEGVPEPAEDDEALMRAYCRRWAAALAEIATTPAAGLAGVAVKARCLVCEQRDGDTVHGARLAEGLLADLERLVGPPGPSASARPGAGHGLPVLALAGAAATHTDAELLRLGRELDAARAQERAIFAAAAAAGRALDDDEADAALDPCSDLAERIRRLPAATLDGLRVKARAFAWASNDEAPDPEAEDTTDRRVMCSILRDLLAAEGRHHA